MGFYKVNITELYSTLLLASSLQSNRKAQNKDWINMIDTQSKPKEERKKKKNFAF